MGGRGRLYVLAAMMGLIVAVVLSAVGPTDPTQITAENGALHAPAAVQVQAGTSEGVFPVPTGIDELFDGIALADPPPGLALLPGSNRGGNRGGGRGRGAGSLLALPGLRGSGPLGPRAGAGRGGGVTDVRGPSVPTSTTVKPTPGTTVPSTTTTRKPKTPKPTSTTLPPTTTTQPATTTTLPPTTTTQPTTTTEAPTTTTEAPTTTTEATTTTTAAP